MGDMDLQSVLGGRDGESHQSSETDRVRQKQAHSVGIGGRPHNVMLRSMDQITYFDNLRERKELTQGNRIMEDLEKGGEG